MVGLLDIGDLSKKVEIRGKQVEVWGMSARTFFHLLATIPELADALAGMEQKDINVSQVIMRMPDTVATIIACSTCGPSWQKMEQKEKDKHIQIAGALTIGEQADLIKAAWEMTFPNGTKSFIEALAEVRKLTGWETDPAQLSPEQLKPSDQTVGQPTFGTARRAN